VFRTAFITMGFLTCAVVPARAQDAAAGEKDFVVCRACHQIGPNAKNAVGPVLNGIIGRTAGTYPDYAYSPANKDSGLVWDPDELDKYLTSPQTVVPHTKNDLSRPEGPAKAEGRDRVSCAIRSGWTKETVVRSTEIERPGLEFFAWVARFWSRRYTSNSRPGR